MTPDLQRASDEAARLFVDIYEKLETRKVAPGIDFKSLVDLFRDTLKNEGVGLLEALRDFKEKVVPNSLAIPHPLYLGLVNSSPLPGAAFADHLISTLNNNDGGVRQSALACEEEVILKEVYELPECWNGLTRGRKEHSVDSRARNGPHAKRLRGPPRGPALSRLRSLGRD
jgi:hypothetical protein